MYVQLLDGLEKPEDRERLHRLVTVRRTRVVNDPDLPPELQGLETPDWWDDDDPFADTWELPQDGDG